MIINLFNQKKYCLNSGKCQTLFNGAQFCSKALVFIALSKKSVA